MYQRNNLTLLAVKKTGKKIPYGQNFIDAVLAAGGSLTAGQQTIVLGHFDELQGKGVINTTKNFLKVDNFKARLYVGGTAAAHLIEAKTALSNGSFVGTWTHNANGSQADGISGCLNTGFIPDNFGTSGNLFAAVRSGNNFATGVQKQLFFGGSATGTTGLGVLVNYPYGFNMAYACQSVRVSGIAAVASAKGFFSCRKTGTTIYLDKDGLNLHNAGGATYQTSTTEVIVNAANYAGTKTDFCDSLIQSEYYMNYISQAETLILNNICADFQNKLGRL